MKHFIAFFRLKISSLGKMNYPSEKPELFTKAVANAKTNAEAKGKAEAKE